MPARLFVSFYFLVMMAASSAPFAQEQGRSLRVAASACPPIVIRDEAGMTGLGVFLWEQVAIRIGADFELIEFPLGDLLGAIGAEYSGQQRIDVVFPVSPLPPRGTR